MNRAQCTRIAGYAAILCLAFFAWSQAQDAKQNPTYRIKEGDTISSVGIISPEENDRRIVRWLIPDQQAVIECSKMAQERATNENVKQFAQMMVSEHNSCLDKLESIRKRRSDSTEAAKPSLPPVTKAEGAEVDLKKSGIVLRDEDGKQRDGKMVYHPTDFVKVKEEICNEMKSTMAKEMKSISGSEFDRAYVMHMVAGHEAILSSCKAVRKTASKELQAMLDQNIEKITNHLKQARQLAEQVVGKTTGSLDANDKSKKVR